MKLNLIVLVGLLLVGLSSIFLPVITFTQKAPWLSRAQAGSLSERSGLLLAVAMLVVMLLRGNRRGVLWIVLGTAGLIWTPAAVSALSESVKQVSKALDRTFFVGEPSYAAGFFLVMLGYVVVILGAMWDIAQTRTGADPRRGRQAIRRLR